MRSREAVARAIHAKAGPGPRWEELPIQVLEYWGGIADAAEAAIAPEVNELIREAVGTERILASVRNQDIRDLLEELITTAFDCVTAPDDARHRAVPVEHLRALLDKHEAASHG